MTLGSAQAYNVHNQSEVFHASSKRPSTKRPEQGRQGRPQGARSWPKQRNGPVHAHIQRSRRAAAFSANRKTEEETPEARTESSTISNLKPALTILSFGGGVQTTALLMMCVKGDMPRPDHVIFADTQGESKGTYEYVERLQSWAFREARISIITVTKSNLIADYIGGVRSASIPFFMLRPDGAEGKLRRSCTERYKIRPVYKEVRRLLGLRSGQRYRGNPVETWLGLTCDESHRMKDNPKKWIVNRYPLIEKGLHRKDCLDYIKACGWPRPPRSSCIFCPYHSDAHWADMKANRPAEWQEVIAQDRQVREAKKGMLDCSAFMHRSCKPIDEVKFGDGRDGFGEECAGMCNV